MLSVKRLIVAFADRQGNGRASRQVGWRPIARDTPERVATDPHNLIVTPSGAHASAPGASTVETTFRREARTPSYLDSDAIELEGRYVHPDLVRICHELGVAGY